MAHAWRRSHRLRKAVLCLITAGYCAIPVLSHGASGQTTLGARVGNKTGEGFISILAPLSSREDSLLFLNPRFTLKDEGETEGNIGLGFRKKLAGHDAILGANVYYDSRRSQHDNRFNQWGAGLEFLSKWIDARINYYDPEGKEEMINAAQIQDASVDVRTDVSTGSSTSVSTSSAVVGTSTATTATGPFFTSNNIATSSSAATTTATATTTTRRTTTTTTRTTTRTTTMTDMFFEQFEAGLEGIDAEVGVMLPLPESSPEVRLFAGYYDFDGAFDTEIKGAKGRLEVRAGPFVTLDAEVFEDKELNGTNWFLGARLHFPFDTGALMRGENPFKVPKQTIKQFRNRPIAKRLVEDVIRDVRVQTEESEFAENKALRQVDVQNEVDVQKSSSTRVSRSTVIEENTVVSGGTTILTDANNPITVNHVNDSNAAGDGTIEHPHGALDDADADPNKTNRNIVFVHSGTTFTNQSYTAVPNQRVLGEGDNNQHLVNTDQLGVTPLPESSPGANGNPRPVIQNTAGVAFDANNNTEISNFTINSPGTGVRMNALSGNVNANRLTVINSTTGIDIIGGAGQFTLTDVTVTDPTARGININGGTSNIVFGSTVIDPGNGLFGPGDINQSANGSALMVMGGHSGSFMFNNGTINATNGDGLQFNNADGNYGFAGPITLNGGDAGIDILGNSNGTFTFAGTTSITNPTGDAINVTGDGTNNPSIIYSGNIQNNAGDAVEINDTAGGANSITFQTGTISDSGSGIFLNSVSQNVNFNGTATLGGSEGIDINGGSGTFSFTDTDITNPSGEPGLDIAGGSSQVNFGSASSIAQNQNRAAVNVNVHGDSGGIDFNGTIVATNGTGLQFNNADGTYDFAGPITLNGGDAGIDILTDSAGTFTFDGTTAITNSTGPAVNIDGGVVGQNAQATFNALDINQSIGAGVLANNSASLTINFGEIDNTMGDGINVTNTNLTVDFTKIGVNAAIGDDGIEIVNSDATSRMATLTNNNIFPLAGSGIANRGIFINSSGTGTLTANVTTNQIEASNQAILTNSGATAGSLVLDLQNSTLTRDTAGFTEEHVGGGLNSTIVRSWDGPNQVIGNPGGGILFDQVTFDASGTSLSGTQVVMGGTGTLQIGQAISRVQGDGLSFLNPTGDLSIPTLNIFNNGGTGLEVDTKGLGTTFNLAVGGGSINTTGGPAMFLDPLTGNLSFGSATSNGGGITLNEFDGTLTIGTTTVTNPAGDGIVVINDGTGAGPLNFGDTDITGLGASTGVDLTQANGNIIFNTLDVTGSGAAGSTGIDLTGSTNAGTVMTNDTSSIQNVQMGVDLTNANMTGMLQFGDGENVNDTASTIDTGGVAGNNAIVITGLNSTNGSYNFLDVDFASPPSSNSDISNLAGPDVYWVDMIGAGTGTKATPGSVTGANSSTADVIVLVNSAAATEVIDASNDAAQGSDDTLTLDSDQVLVSFNTSDSLDLAALGVAGGAPANVLLTGIVATSTVDNKFNGFAPTLTTTGVNNTVELGNNSDLVGVNLANGGTGHALSGNGVTGAVTVSNLDIDNGGSGADGVNLTGGSANYTFNSLSVANTAGDGVEINNASGSSIFNGGSITGATGDSFSINGGTAGVTYSGGITHTAAGQAAVSVSGGHNTGTVTFNAGTISATNGTGLQFNNADGVYNFNGTTTLNGGDAGIDIVTGSNGTFTFTNGTTITSPTGTALNIDTSTGGNVTYDGTIVQNNAANAVRVNSKTGGTVDVNGLVTANTSTATGINLTSNSGGTINFDGGLDVDTTTGTGFSATGGGTVNVSGAGNSINSTNGQAVDLNGITSGITFDSVTSNVSGAEGIDIDDTTGSFTVSGLTDIDNSTTDGINVASSAATVSFNSLDIDNTGGDGIELNNNSGSFSVSGNTDVNNASSFGINIQGGTGGFSFAGVDINNRNSAGIVVNGGNQTGSFGATSIDNPNTSATSAIGIDNTTGGSVTFTSVTIDNNGANSSGVALSGNAGAVDIQGGSITGANGAAFSVASGSGNVDYDGSITNTAGRSVQILNNTGGTINVTGNINDTGTGINVAGNSGGTTVTFSGASKTINTGTNTAVTLNNNTGVTINFTGGGLDIDTTTGTGFTATGGGTVTVQDTGNTVTSGTGTAVNIQGTTLGASGVTFQSVSANGGTTGININNGGTTGFFTVTGVGTTDGSGGTIQNTTQNGILIQNTDNITLNNMNLTNAANDGGGAGACSETVFTGCNAAVEFNTVKVVDITNISITGSEDHGIFGQTVTDLDINNTDITGLGADVDTNEHGIFVVNLLGTTAAGTNSVFDGLTIDDAQDTAIRIQNSTATNPGNTASPDQLTLRNSILTDAGDSGLNAITTTTNGNLNIIATGNTITNTVDGVSLEAQAGNMQGTIGGAGVLSNTINAGVGGDMVNGIRFFASAATGAATLNASAINNTITLFAQGSPAPVSGLNGIGVSAGGASSGNLGTIRATVSDNTINSSFAGLLTQTVHGVIVTNEGTGTTSQNVVSIDDNVITLNPATGTTTAETVGVGVDGGTTGAGTTVRITNNTIVATGDASNGASVGIQILPTEVGDPAGTNTRVCVRVTGNNVSTPNNPLAGAFLTTELDVIAAPVVSGSFLDVEGIPTTGVRTPAQLKADLEPLNTSTEVGDTTGLITGTITGVASCPN